MKIDNLKDLENVVKLCKKHGVRNIEVDGIKMQIEEVLEAKNGTAKEEASDANKYSEEELLMWSAGALNG